MNPATNDGGGEKKVALKDRKEEVVRAKGFLCCKGAPLRTADVVIIGAGFGGGYVAYSLSKIRPDLNVVLLEKDENVGGRLYSDDNDMDNETNKDELGGMRIFPSKQKEVADLIEELGLHLVPIALKDKNNWFYAAGERVRKKDHRINGKTPSELINSCRENFKKAKPEQATLPPMECPEMRNLSLTEFLLKYGATQEEVDAWFTYSGYDIFSSNDVQASIFFHEGDLYDSKLDDDQKYVQEGFQLSVQRMIERSKAKLELGCKVQKLVKGPKGRVNVVYRNELGDSQMIAAKQVVCALPYDAMVNLSKQSPVMSANRKTLLRDSVMIIPLFKCFLEWERHEGEPQWWEKHGFWAGKSTTDLHVRQVHYYDHEDVLLYNSGRFAVHWDKEFRKDSNAAARKMYEQIKLVHGMDDIPEPDWSSTIFKFWPNGSHKWKKGVNIAKSIPKICDGRSDKSNIHISGDAFSSHQGWTAGCIETGKIALEAILASL